MTDPRPANVPWLTPYLAVRNARAAIDFFKAAFGFELRDVLNGRDVGVRKEFVTATLKAHACAVFRGRLVKL